jgi:hypothetical protein
MHASLLLLLLAVTVVYALNVTTLTPVPPPVIAANATLVLLDQRAYDTAYSVPAWMRTDTTLPAATMLAADDFSVPATVGVCTALTVDAGLLRAMGLTPGNARVPLNGTLWLWDDATFRLGRTLAQTPAPVARITVQTPAAPANANWSSATDGITVTNAGYYHMESVRFDLPATVYGGRTYWVALDVALERAFNSTDFSQNQPRWMTTTTITAPSQVYRVIDVNGTLFHGAPQLQNWTSAAAAEPIVLPWLTASIAPMYSPTQQLALGVFASNCTLTGNATTISAVPPRYVPAPVAVPVPLAVPSSEPVPSPSGSSKAVVVPWPASSETAIPPSPLSGIASSWVAPPSPSLSVRVPSSPTPILVFTPSPPPAVPSGASNESIPPLTVFSMPLYFAPSPSPPLASVPDTVANVSGPPPPPPSALLLSPVQWTLLSASIAMCVILALVAVYTVRHCTRRLVDVPYSEVVGPDPDDADGVPLEDTTTAMGVMVKDDDSNDSASGNGARALQALKDAARAEKARMAAAVDAMAPTKILADYDTDTMLPVSLDEKK